MADHGRGVGGAAIVEAGSRAQAEPIAASTVRHFPRLRQRGYDALGVDRLHQPLVDQVGDLLAVDPKEVHRIEAA